MRIKLKVGKQRELISEAKANKTWAELSKELNVNKNYLKIDLYNENRLLHSKIFYRLCKIAKIDFSRYIEKRLSDEWGKKIGGKISSGTTKKIIKPRKSAKLAELIGIILGDGNLYWNEKKGVYTLKIAGNPYDEREYLIDFVKPLLDEIFKTHSKIEIRKNELFITVYSKEIIKILEFFGLKRGNKIKNNVGIPYWIKDNKNFLKACIRGLIDTDGSVFKMSNKDSHLNRIGFKNSDKKLLNDTRKGLVLLGFHPSKIIKEDHFFISRKKDTKRYANVIKFNNPKHVRRLINIAP
jgi:intein/homing endonuclease